MQKRIKPKDLAVVILFLGVLAGFLVANLLKPSDELSYSERRRLAQFPDISFETVTSGKAMTGFNDYSVDQFIFRERLRTLKAVFDINIWQKADNNKIFTVGDYVFKTEYPLQAGSVRRLCKITNYIFEEYLQGMNVKGDASVAYAFIPDKNHYLSELPVRDGLLGDSHRHLVLDYMSMKAIIRENTLAEIHEIELFDTLSIGSYYLTDAHWKQETLGETAETIADAMGAALRFDSSQYTYETFSPFYGAYFGQSALSIDPDELVYLKSDVTDSAIVTSAELPGKLLPVYDETALGGMDSYNVFLLGPQALIRVENPRSADGKELIIFRDSFSSSIAPLLLPAYSAITLVDLRYINPELISQYIDFTDQDVLFMYSAGIFNNSDSIRAPSGQEFVSPFVARSVEIDK